MGPKFKRNQLWVDGPFQSRLLLRMGCYLVTWALIAFHASFILYLVVHYLANSGQDGVYAGTGSLYVEFFSQQKPFLMALILIAPCLLYDLLKFSNRFAGPLFRCRKVMRDMAAGQIVPEFKARKHDLMVDLFLDFNSLIKEWNARIARQNGHAGNANAAELTIDERPPSARPAAAEPERVTV